MIVSLQAVIKFEFYEILRYFVFFTYKYASVHYLFFYPKFKEPEIYTMLVIINF